MSSVKIVNLIILTVLHVGKASPPVCLILPHSIQYFMQEASEVSKINFY